MSLVDALVRHNGLWNQLHIARYVDMTESKGAGEWNLEACCVQAEGFFKKSFSYSIS
jgi:hypothetical protein